MDLSNECHFSKTLKIQVPTEIGPWASLKIEILIKDYFSDKGKYYKPITTTNLFK